MSGVSTGSPPPSIWYNVAPCSCAHRSYSAISTAALALVLRSIALCTSPHRRLRLATSWPIRRGAMKWRIASMIEPWVSPVITAVAGASP
ncbi:hypothetical protein G6F24_018896 [Rhizopus arrhizus]|nr:hypothetical protein G6F24_018896 [Rhizopus arrhizus]